jgi:hypothetical protein
VAVVLSELIAQPECALADRAWEIIETRFQDWSSRVGDVKEAMLWGLVKNLLKRARAAKEQVSQITKQPQSLHPSNLDLSLQGMDIQETSSAFFGAGSDDFGWVDQMTSQPMDFLSFDPGNIETFDTELTNTSSNINNWNDFCV